MVSDTHYDNDNVADKDIVCSKAIRKRMSRCVNLAKAMYDDGYTSHGRTFNVTFVFNKSKLLSVGLNNYNHQVNYISELMMKYKKIGEKSYNPCLHSELASVIKLGRLECSDLDFYVVRIDKNKHCCFSKPCINCQNVLKTVGFKNVYYFDKEMNFRKL